MIKYIIFSKSLWNEPPRLRHQITNLLQSLGQEIIFFERPDFFWSPRQLPAVEQDGPVLKVRRSRQLLHHQLRVSRSAQALNAVVEKHEIRRVLSTIDTSEAAIVNFNYDYCFLRDIFPSSKILTIINDDFVAMARLFGGKHAQEQLKRTCIMSDSVLAASYPLMEQLSAWCSPELFLPWADTSYRSPPLEKVRDRVLIWAYINDRIDFRLLGDVVARLPDLTFDVVGPIARAVENHIARLKERHGNFNVLPPLGLDDLSVEQYCCSLVPYSAGQKFIEATTMPNKGLQLLARGLPIVAHGMPRLLDHPAIARCSDAIELALAIGRARDDFCELQLPIRTLVSENQGESRLKRLREVLG